MIQIPDGSDAAIHAYGEYGTRDRLAATVNEHGAYGAADIYGVSEPTLRTWRKTLGLHVKPRLPAQPMPPRVCECCGAEYRVVLPNHAAKWALRRYCGRLCSARSYRRAPKSGPFSAAAVR